MDSCPKCGAEPTAAHHGWCPLKPPRPEYKINPHFTPVLEHFTGVKNFPHNNPNAQQIVEPEPDANN